MKKIISLIAVVSFATFSFANESNKNSINTAETTVVEKQENQKVIEFKIVTENGLTTCYERECWIGSRDNGDGTTSEVKVCSDWEEVPCPQPSGPQPPVMTLG